MNSALSVAPGQLQNIFKQYLPDPSVIFVFSTDVVMNSWVDWCVCHEEESGVSAVPLERFVSWDKFKGEYVSASEPGKSPVPALLRKLFVQDLIRRNAQSPFFKKIINPDFAGTAGSFTDWISKMLPSLQLWHTLIAEHPEITRDDEDSDFEILYKEYAGFLAANNFFEPAWTVPDFSDSGKKILIIYPETLEDFADYTGVFDKCPAITLVTMPSEEPPHPVCIKYSDSRKELRMTILAIRKLVADGKAAWTDITLNVPDLETYRPYLERELKKYCVPFVIRAGFPLTSNCAGIIFNEILDCYTSDFSYDSVRALLLDNYIPWKKEFEEVKENLIREGQRLRCICSYNENGSEKIDIWKEALSKINHDEREYTFYSQLKKDITAICQSNTFAAIHVAWMAFKTRYLEASEFSQTADKIISRCITELNTLISIEKTYCEPIGLSVDSPYEFFINELSKKTYTPQNSAVGISVYPYKLAAAAAFKYQFVIDSSQNNLELPFKRLSFLNAGKRSLLKLADEDKRFNASKAFIRLYAKSGDDTIPMFSCAEESFAGFAIAHTYLKTTDKNPIEEELEKSDFVQEEKSWFLSLSKDHNQIALSQAQQDQFLRWYSFNKSRYEEPVPYEVPDSLKNKINWYLVQNRNKHNPNAAADDGKITISQSDMKAFFPCPRRWIFDKVLNLEPDSLSTSLIGRYDMGNIHHKIMELYGQYLMKKDQPLPKVVDGMLENEYELIGIINGFALEAIHDPQQEFSKSPLTTKMLESQIPAITETIINFLHSFCEKFEGYYVRGVEKWYGAASQNNEWNYTGKIDCILTAGSGHPEDTGWTIIDYKNSVSSIPAAKDAVVSDDGILGDFQMPMYITLIRENEKVKDITQAAFYAINTDEKNSRVIVGNGRYSKTMEEYESTIRTFEEYAQNFAECVEESDYPLTQVDAFEDCGGCSYKSICRYNYTIAGRTK
ncbi:MAG: PD-(D/E)XK nuclease family protein [Treponema sp.]|nr:PD-(D/E)XK nuclease family protein [Treponema sp.]